MTEKSILEQALLQVQNLEEAVKQNAKGILASTMKEELKDLLKESLEEEEETEVEVDEQPETEENPEEEGDDMSDDSAIADDTENDTNLDNEPSKGIDSMDSGLGIDDSEELSTEDMGSDDDVMDMTGASDEEVLKVFKAMKPEDGIVVKKDGDNIEFSDGEDEYIIKLDGDTDSIGGDDLSMGSDFDDDELSMGTDFEDDEDSVDFPSVSDDMADEDSEDEEIEDLEDEEEDSELEENIYEIELDEEDEEEEEMSEEEEEATGVKKDTKEAARTYGADVRTPANQGKKYKAGRHEMNEEVENLKKQNSEYKKALVLFKEKLNEVAVFNANLAYATRLFTEHSTTKQEKLNILKRFDSVSTMNEAKTLFSTIKNELGNKTTVTESVAVKISNTPSTSASQEMLAEAKAYENPQFKRMKDLMSKLK
jgi:hypothetical protein